MRRRSGGVFGASPADEERDQAIGQRAVCRAPPQYRTCRPDPVPVLNLARVIARGCGLRRPPGRCRRRLSPANQLAAGNAVEDRGLGLVGVRGDDLQVGPGAERKQRVVRAKTNVLAACLGANAKPAF